MKKIVSLFLVGLSNLAFSQEDCSTKLEISNIQIKTLNTKIDSLKLKIDSLNSTIGILENFKQSNLRHIVKYDHLILDSLILVMTPAIVKRDEMLLKDIPNGNEIIYFFKAKELLNNKYDKAKLNEFREPLKRSLLAEKTSIQINNLLERLDYYESMNKGLIEVLKKIIEIDSKNLPTKQEKNENLDKRHRERIGGEIALYIYDYQFKAEDYPYLQRIIEEVILLKAQDAYSDISNLLKKL